MSSTTDRRAERGQILVMFAGGLFTLIVVAALAFDTGMMLLQRRDQQNAADAAALAGARYLIGTPAQDPALAARGVATANGFTDGLDDATVEVFIPPAHGRFKNNEGFIEVEITTNRPSIFAWVMGIFGWDVSARAVAANQHGVPLEYSMISLHPTWCDAVKVTGQGAVESNGSVQVNSSCDPALRTSGTGNLTVTLENSFCNAVGGITDSNNSQLNCSPAEENSYFVEDPLLNLPAPPVPDPAAAVVSLSGQPIPQGCPGSAEPATAANPALCKFTTPGAVWRLYPGYYPGGLDLGGSTRNPGIYYLEPGIYYLGGGGLRVASASVTSVDPGTTTYGGGVLIYSSIDAYYADECSQTPPVPPVYSDFVLVGIASSDAAANVITTSKAHGLSIGDEVTVDGHDGTGANGTWTVLSVPSTTTLTLDNGLGVAVDITTSGTQLGSVTRIVLPALPDLAYPDGSIVYDLVDASSPNARSKQFWRNNAGTWESLNNLVTATGAPWPSWPCMGEIHLNGGVAPVNLMPLNDDSDWDGMVLYTDRNFSLGKNYWCGTVPPGYPTPVACETLYEVIINGGGSDMEIRGTIYLPDGDIKVNGDAGTLTLDQMITSTMDVNGNVGTIEILYELGAFSRIRGVGLVE